MRGWRAEDDQFEAVGRVTELLPEVDEPLPPPPVRGGVLAAFDPGRRGVRALAAVAALVACIAAFMAWRARPQAMPVPPVQSAGVAAPSVAPSVLVVSVGGRVRRPGLVRLPAGARVADAIEAAGGALPDTDLSQVNLARKVVDGELIVIGITPPPAAGPTAKGGLVNINTATLGELQTLPGIGAVLAQRIVDYRTEHGGFRSINDLRQVDGIGESKFAQLKDRVTV
jgi:competence protein ComEA